MLRRIGPLAIAFETDLPDLARAVERLYADYPEPADGIADFRVRIAAPYWWRRHWRPQIAMQCDLPMPFLPLPRALGTVAFEMAFNYQVAMGFNRHVLLHASCIARDDQAILLSGASGSGKSTLAAALGYGSAAGSDWRFMADEFAMVDPATARLSPFPRPISLKNDAIAVMRELAPPGRFSPAFSDTPKGTICYLLPPQGAISAMDWPARVRLCAFPQFDAAAREPELRRLDVGESFVRLAASSTNYFKLGEPGFDAVVQLARRPAFELRYASLDGARALVEQIWREAGDA